MEYNDLEITEDSVLPEKCCEKCEHCKRYIIDKLDFHKCCFYPPKKDGFPSIQKHWCCSFFKQREVQ